MNDKMMDALDAYLENVPGRIEQFLKTYEKRRTPLTGTLLEKWGKFKYKENVHTVIKNYPDLIEKLNKMFELDYIAKKPLRAHYAQKVNVEEKTKLQIEVELDEDRSEGFKQNENKKR